MDAVQHTTDRLAQTTLEDRTGTSQEEVPQLGPVAPPELDIAPHGSGTTRRHRRGNSPCGEDDDEEDGEDYDDAYGVSGSGRGGARGPHFFPPLWLARRTACLQHLRAENIRTVADLGCGKGAVLSMLVQPAWHKDDFPELYPPAPDEVTPDSADTAGGPGSKAPGTATKAGQYQTRSEKLAVLRRVPRVLHEENELHLSRVIGVDLDRTECEAAARTVKPLGAEKNGRVSTPGQDRWEDLRVEVYEGGVEVFNEALQGVEAVILTEVIEHLSEAALAKLPYILFSLYAPRLVIITTPNHAFNPYFPPPASSPSNGKSPLVHEEDGHLFPDPTGRTNRVFRDATHTLEWTPEEFRSWCDGLLKTHASDYEVTIGGVGSLAAYWSPSLEGIPFPPPSLSLHPEMATHPACTVLPAEPDQFFATQVAVFKRQYSGEAERSPRSARPTPLPFFSPSSAPTELPPSPGASVSSLPPQLPSSSSSCKVAKPLPAPKPEHELIIAATHPAHPSTRDSPPPSLSIIREVIEAVFLSVGEGDQLSLADLWRIGGDNEIGLRVAAQGLVGRVVDALVGSPTAVPDACEILADDADPDTSAEELSATNEGAGAEEFVLSLDETKTGLDALRIRWLEYDEAYRTYRLALDAARKERALLEAEEDEQDEEEATRTDDADGGQGEEGVLALDERPLDEPVQLETPSWGGTPYGPPQPASTAAAWTLPKEEGEEKPILASWDEDDW
ncbi:hypothetical protein JCM10908_006819 [Rhodotorula pacifica]|uniref:uncharacterized protein n=1 Tax=Rhodotorula pacifica TaxID=1495444 RepID=UPI0031777D23